VANQAIISLAILKVNFDVLGKTYLDNFVPFVAEAIRLSTDEIVSLPALRQQLAAHFGLTIPQKVISAILRRARKQGYVRLENGVFARNLDKLAELEFAAIQQRVVEQHEALVDSLVRFCAERFDVKLSRDEAEGALLSCMEDYQLLLFDTATQWKVIPSVETPIKSAKFLVASFVQHLQETHAAAFEYLETVVKGHMLANAIFLPDPNQAERNFRNTEVYFDTSFLIFVLGYAGEALRDPCRELLDLLYGKGAQLRCFRHTLDEVRGALDACAYRMARGQLRDAHGPSIEYFLTRGYTASDIELFCVRLEDDLRALRVRVVDKPPYEHSLVIDEAELERVLDNEVRYSNPQARVRDVDSISAIIRLRRGREFFVIEESRALFVTTNSSLSRAVQFFLRDATPGAVTPCLTDDVLTTLVWLKSPQKAPDLPKKRIIADCYAAIQPSDRLWQLYLAEIDKLEKAGRLTTDDYYLLRHSIEAKAVLMDLTLGNEEAFCEGTVPEILEHVRSRVRTDLVSKLESEVEARQEAEKAARSAKAREEEIRARLKARAQNYARVVTKAIEYGVLLLLVVGTASTFPWTFPPPRVALFRYLISVVQMFLLILSVGNLMYGTKIEEYIRKWELGMSGWFYLRLLDITYQDLGRPVVETEGRHS